MRRLILSTAFFGFAAVASAQLPAGPGWSSFAGCWTPVGADGSRNVAANTPRVCVVPSTANANVADLLTVVNDSITSRTPINANGQQDPVGKQGCTGWEKAEFSADGRRLFLRSEQICAGGLKRLTSGIFAIASNGDMINVVDVGADSASNVRVTRYATATVAPTMPAEIRETLAAREMSDRTARVAAQREVSVNAVIEASRYLSAPAEEAWLAELEQDFNLDEKTLIRLADEKVPPSVIDIMIAVSNPRQFSVSSTGSISTDEQGRERNRAYAPCFAPVIDPWAWYPYDPCDPYLRYGYYRSRYYRGGYYGFDPYWGYGYGRYGTYGGYGTVIIVNNGNPPVNRPHGRMTKDGYKRGDDTATPGASTSRSGSESTRQATRSSSGSDATRSSGDSGKSSSGSTSSGSSSSGSSSSGGNGGRTATRKPPTS